MAGTLIAMTFVASRADIVRPPSYCVSVQSYLVIVDGVTGVTVTLLSLRTVIMMVIDLSIRPM